MQLCVLLIIIIIQSLCCEIAEAQCFHPGHGAGVYMNFSRHVDQYGRYPEMTIVNASCERHHPVTRIRQCQRNGTWLTVNNYGTKLKCDPDRCKLKGKYSQWIYTVINQGDRCYPLYGGLDTSTFEYWNDFCDNASNNPEQYAAIRRHCDTYCRISRNKNITVFLQEPKFETINFFLLNRPILRTDIIPWCLYMSCYKCNITVESAFESKGCTGDEHYWSCVYNITGCGIPGQRANTQMTYTGTFFHDNATYKCPPGFYLLSGNLTRTCQENGNWSGNSLYCARRRCPMPNNSTCYKLLNNSLHHGSWVEHWCRPGQVLKGKRFRMCMENGTWSGRVPECKTLSDKTMSQKSGPSCITTDDVIAIIVSIVVVVVSLTWITVGIIFWKDRHGGKCTTSTQ